MATKTTNLSEMPALHPIVEALPEMDEQRFASFVEDVRANGLSDPITLDADGRVIDGRHRLRACIAADVIPRYETVDAAADVVAVVWSKNLERRHLSPKELAMAAARLRQFARESGRKMSIQEAAELTGAAPRSVKRAITELDPRYVHIDDAAFRFSSKKRADAVREAMALGALSPATLQERTRRRYLDKVDEDALDKALEFCITRGSSSSAPNRRPPSLDLVLFAIEDAAEEWRLEKREKGETQTKAAAMRWAALSQAGQQRWIGAFDEDEDVPAQTDGEAADETALADDEDGEAAADGEVEEAGGRDALSVDPQGVGPRNDEHGLSWQERLLYTLIGMDPSAFERLCQRMLRESGFIEVEVTGRSGDGGIDGHGIIRMGGLISFPVLFQCKRYQGNVAASVVRDFRGAMQGRSDKGLLITTGGFTRDAKAEATRDGAPPIDLIDGSLLAEKLKEIGLGVKTEMVEQVTVDAAFFKGV